MISSTNFTLRTARMKLKTSYKTSPYYMGHDMFIQYLSHDHSNRNFTDPTKFCSSASHICQANTFTLVFLICHKNTANLQKNNNGKHSILMFFIIQFLVTLHCMLHDVQKTIKPSTT